MARSIILSNMKISESVTVHIGDCRDSLKAMKERGEKAQMCVTSPPYYGLRDYGHEGQIGLEQTPEEYIAAMVQVFRCVRDVLADDGTLWLNIGDSYNGSGGQGTKPNIMSKEAAEGRGGKPIRVEGLKQKDLIGIPWMLAFALRADGWYLRQDIIWHKPNPMPESVTDRCTKSHEYLFLLSKSERYYFDNEAIKETVSQSTIDRLMQPTLSQQEGSNRVPGKTNGNMKAVGNTETRNRRSVWTVSTKPYTGAHFAVYPPELIEPCIKAGSREGDTVLDPFGGSGTTAGVCMALHRKAVLCELNPAYAELVPDRIDNVLETYGYSPLGLKDQHALFG